MPLQTETLAIINELDRPVNSNRRQDQLLQYARDVAAAHRDVYPADDEEVTTLEWIVLIGGTDDDPSTFTFSAEGSHTLSFSVASEVTTATIIDTSAVETELGEYSTRGAVRRLLTALGVAFTG